VKSTKEQDHPDIVAWPPLIFSVCTIAGVIFHFIFPVPIMRYPWSLAIGLALALSSASLAIWAARVMKAAGTNVRPDRPALAIVTSGPYRFTRNPMYLSLVLLQLAIGFMLDGLIPMLFVVATLIILHFGVVLREESYLEGKFGEQYLTLKRQVRRWI